MKMQKKNEEVEEKDEQRVLYYFIDSKIGRQIDRCTIYTYIYAHDL